MERFCLLIAFACIVKGANLRDSCQNFPTGNFFINSPFPPENHTVVGPPYTPETNISLSWVHNCSSQTTTFSLVGNTLGWLGIGFVEPSKMNQSALMQNADIYEFSINGTANGTAAFVNRWAYGNHEPIDDPVQAFVGTPSIELNGVQLTANFTRNWTAASSYQVPLSAAPLYVLTARGLISNITKFHFAQRFFALDKLYLFGAPTPSPTPPNSSPCQINPSGSFDIPSPFPFLNDTQPPTNVSINWNHNCTANTTTFTLIGNTAGWLGVGFLQPSRVNNTFLMTNGDFYQCNPTNCTNRFGIGNTQPRFDSPMAFIGNQTTSYVGKLLTASFTRAWAPISADQVPLNQGPLYVLVARGPEAIFTKYHYKQRAFIYTTVDLFGPPQTPMPTTTTTAPPTQTTTTNNEPNPCDHTGTISNKLVFNLANDAITTNYIIDCAAKTINFTINGVTTGWLAIGFNANGPVMKGGDVYQFSVSNTTGAVALQNGYCPGHDVDPDTTQGMIVGTPTGSRNGTSITVSFARRLAALTADNTALTYSVPVYVMIARRMDSGDFSEHHPHDGSGRFVTSSPIQLFSQTPFGPESIDLQHILLIIHGALMFIAFAVLMPIGTFFARHLKDIGHSWFVTHRAMMMVATVFAFAAFIISIVHVVMVGGEHFQLVESNPHTIVGLVIMILCLIQPILGFVADNLFVANRFEVPAFPDRVHWWLGRLIVVAAFVNIYLGFKLFPGLEPMTALPTSVIVFLIWSFLCFVYQIIGQISLGVVHHLHYGVQFSDRSHSEVQRLLDGKQNNVARSHWWAKRSMLLIVPGVIVAVLSVLLAYDPDLFFHQH